MFEEPVRYFIDVAQRNRSVLDLLYGSDTFVNPSLAQHYGMPEPKRRPERRGCASTDADRYGRGGLLPMAVFLTKNAPGLRTSPVKRGYWVVRRVLGEQIPPPPPTVPELPKDEAKLGELTLPRDCWPGTAPTRAAPAATSASTRSAWSSRASARSASAATKDLGGRPVETAATFPDGKEGTGLDGLAPTSATSGRTISSTTCAASCCPTPSAAACCLSDDKALDEMKSEAGRRTDTRSAAWWSRS